MPYTLNGTTLNVDSEPRLENGTLWVPLRKLATALGGKADWEPANNLAILYLGDTIALFRKDDPTVDINGEKRELQAPIKLEDGETWIPVRFFEHIGYSLAADPQRGLIVLSN